MFIEMAESCPWVSVFPMDLAKRVKENQAVAVVELFAKVTLEAVTLYERGGYAQLDALVGNNGCEVHSFVLLSFAHNVEFKKECQAMHATAEAILALVQERKQHKRQKSRLYDQLLGQFFCSVKMQFLVQSRLLTITKKVAYDEEKFGTSGYELLETNVTELRKVCRLKSVDDSLLLQIVFQAQTALSKSSIAFVAAHFQEGSFLRQMLSGSSLFLYEATYFSHYQNRKKSSAPKTYSSSYYNTKALFELLRETKTPLVVKKIAKVGEPAVSTTYICFQRFAGKLAPGQAVVDCMAYYEQEALEEIELYGIDKVILSLTALEDQFVPGHPELFSLQEPQAVRELEEEAVFAKERNLQKLIYVDHFYLSVSDGQ